MDDLWLYADQVLQGACITVQLAVCSLALGMVLGLLLAAGSLSRQPLLRRAVMLWTAVLRGIPEFLIVLVCYFWLSNVINTQFGGSFDLSPFVAGVFALSIVFSAYAAEVFRGSFAAIPKGQIEAAQALGLRPAQTFFAVRLPQAWRVALPSLGNLWQSLLKDTSLVSVVGLEDLLKKANMAGQATHQPFVFLLAAAAVYFVFLQASQPVQRWLEQRAGAGFGPRSA
ncbi:ABC transporter permease [Hydrogenophaga sp. RWCD_12]|uniref:ABC transporter permease n=1 Tax=Hydrogenophaga sp. RWCD_12 TaxID=3391190 RepID=UPI003984E5B8